jgi:hypothetical protein
LLLPSAASVPSGKIEKKPWFVGRQMNQRIVVRCRESRLRHLRSHLQLSFSPESALSPQAAWGGECCGEIYQRDACPVNPHISIDSISAALKKW